MKLFGGLAFAALISTSPAMAGLVNLEFNPYGSIEHSHMENHQWNSEVVGTVNGPISSMLQVPTGALTNESLTTSDNGSAIITSGDSSFLNFPLDSIDVPFSALLNGYLPHAFDNPVTFTVLSAPNWYWDWGASAEAEGMVDYGANFISFQWERYQTLSQSSDELGTSSISMYQTLYFTLNFADVPLSHEDVILRSADDVRELLAGLNGQSGYFHSAVGIQHNRCENNSCGPTSYDAWGISGWVRGNAVDPIEVPEPTGLLLLSLGLSFFVLRRRR